MFRRGRKFYYRHSVPVDAQSLLGRLEIWRSLRTDSYAVATRRLPNVVARIEIEIEHARAMAGMPVDPTLFQPLKDDLTQGQKAVPLEPNARVQTDSPLTLGEAYSNYIDDPTRAWSANTREAYQTSRKLAVAVLGESMPRYREPTVATSSTCCASYPPIRVSYTRGFRLAKPQIERDFGATSERLAMLDKTRTIRPVSTDGVWLDWPHPVESKKPKKKRLKASRTGRWKVARAFKPGGGKYS